MKIAGGAIWPVGFNDVAVLRTLPAFPPAAELLWVGGWNCDPCRISLGLLPSGPDPVGEWRVHNQPPAAHIGVGRRKCKALFTPRPLGAASIPVNLLG